ncbi:esterase/lipase family protein [Micromonospora sp. NPDC000089]|uniref:esterase/lipase family protein n=1 Tax=unclassified Micromonospora TaxID=2617518 RepID=UPI0036B2ED7C
MINRVEQDSFAPLPRTDQRTRHPLVVHGRPGAAPPTLVLLVHGWGGSRYGTWGLAGYLFADLPLADLGLYDYASGVRRLVDRRRGTSIDLEAQHLADLIRDLPYRQVVLVAHSMGGLLCGEAVTKLINSETKSQDGRPAYEKLAGLFYCGTPQAGTKVPRWLSWLTPDFKVLHVHSSTARRIATTFADRVTTDPGDDGRVMLPVYALVGGADGVVDPLSATLAVPSDRSKHVQRTHRELVQPTDPSDVGYRWLLDRISYVIMRHATTRAAEGGPAGGRSGAATLKVVATMDVVADGAHATLIRKITRAEDVQAHVGRAEGPGTEIIVIEEA